MFGRYHTPSRGQTCGRAVVEVVVDSSGKPVLETARVVRASDPSFGLALLDALPGMRYEPALKQGRPVAQVVRVEGRFQMVAVPAGTPRR